MEQILNQLVEQLESGLKANNFFQRDLRFNRDVWTQVGGMMEIDDKMIDFLVKQPLKIKYQEDYSRMKPYLDYIVNEIKENPNSRRLVALNTEKYLEVFPCFLSIQFLKNERGSYTAVVNQRSGDSNKLRDDLIYFANFSKMFTAQTREKVDKIYVVYGSIHCTKE